MTPVRLELAVPRSRVKHSTTEPLRSLNRHVQLHVSHVSSVLETIIFVGITIKPVLSGLSKLDKTKVLMTNGSQMKVESIAECSPWSILQYF